MAKARAKRTSRTRRESRGQSKGLSLGLEDVVGYNLRRAHGIQRQRFAHVFGPYGIRPVLLSALGLIHESPGLKQSDLGRKLDIKRANIVTLLDELEKRGLITRQTADTDRRSLLLQLTPQGRALTGKLLHLHKRLEEDMAKSLGRNERDRLLDLLKRFRQLDPEPDLG